MFAKKICPQNEKLSIFEKPLTMPFQICKNFCKVLNKVVCKKFAIFFAKLVQYFPYVKGFTKS